MNRFSENKNAVSQVAVANLAEGLRAIAAEFDRVLRVMRDEKIENLDAQSLLTGLDGMIRISKFLGKLQDAYALAPGEKPTSATARDTAWNVPSRSPARRPA